MKDEVDGRKFELLTVCSAGMKGVDGKMFVLGPLKLLIACSVGMKVDVDGRKLVFVEDGNSELGVVGI
jgi:hypothetical protein